MRKPLAEQGQRAAPAAGEPGGLLQAGQPSVYALLDAAAGSMLEGEYGCVRGVRVVAGERVFEVATPCYAWNREDGSYAVTAGSLSEVAASELDLRPCLADGTLVSDILATWYARGPKRAPLARRHPQGGPRRSC